MALTRFSDVNHRIRPQVPDDPCGMAAPPPVSESYKPGIEHHGQAGFGPMTSTAAVSVPAETPDDNPAMELGAAP